MGKINRFLLMLIAMAAIMITAVGIDKGLQYYDARKWDKERVERYRQTYAQVADMRTTISQLSEDQGSLEAFIEENRQYFDEGADDGWLGGEPGERASDVSGDGDNTGEGLAGAHVSGNDADIPGKSQAGEPGSGDSVSGDLLEGVPVGGSVSGNLFQDVSGNSTWGAFGGRLIRDVSGNLLGSISGNSILDVSGNMFGILSDDDIWDVSGNLLGNLSGNGIWDIFGERRGDVSGNEWRIYNSNRGGKADREAGSSQLPVGATLAERRKMRASYVETQMQNDIDLKVIADSSIDFSDVSIACLGDSITEGSNLEDMEDYRQYAYPARLKEILKAKSVTNLGIGGSSIGRYWDKPFVERYKEIPQDTDLILVMGGTNDGFCMTQEDLGTMEERKARTFIGDLDELMRGLKESYPDAEIVFATPLPNVLHDMLRKERDYLLPQGAIVAAIKQLAAEYEIPVIDLYNSNILDTHDAAVIYNYMPDGVHCNPAGYSLLAEHMAAELIKIYGAGAGAGTEGQG